MRVHEFTLILTADPNEEESARLYSIFNDGTLVTLADVPQIHFHRETPYARGRHRICAGAGQKSRFLTWPAWKSNR